MAIRIRVNNQIGTLGASLTATGTTITFASAPGFPTVSGDGYIPISLEPPSGSTPSSNFEIAHLTAYTAGAMTGTILRGQEGTARFAHNNTVVWSHDSTLFDYGDENERYASQLVNAQSTGAAANLSDHFLGSALSSGWANEGTTVSSPITLGNSTANLFQTGTGASQLAQAYTPTGAFRVEARVALGLRPSGSVTPGVGLLIKDNNTADATGNNVLVQMSGGAGSGMQMYTLDSSVYTQRGSTYGVEFDGFIYLAVQRDGSNNWTTQASMDRQTWHTIGTANYNKTMTVAKMAIRFNGPGAGICDFVDVVS